MIIAVPMDEKSEDAEISPVMGRAAYFALYDTEKETTEYIDNPGVSQSRGAGIAAANSLVDAGVEKVISTHVGPNAQIALEAGGIEVVTVEGGTLSAVLKAHAAS